MTRRSRSVIRPLLPLVVVLLGGCTAVSEHAGAEAHAHGGSAGLGASTGVATVATADSASRAATTINESAGVDDTSAAAVTTGHNRTVAPIDVAKEFPYVRALYVNRWAAQSPKRMRDIIRIADETEINGLVIDMKDEFGLNYHPSNPTWARKCRSASTLSHRPRRR